MTALSALLRKNKNIGYVALVTGVILLVPLAAMQFTSEVNWSAFDFLVAGVLLFGTGLVYEVSSRRLIERNQRIALAGLLLLIFLIIWVDLAVGIFR